MGSTRAPRTAPGALMMVTGSSMAFVDWTCQMTWNTGLKYKLNTQLSNHQFKSPYPESKCGFADM